MELFGHSGFVALIIFGINLIFLAGMWWVKLKDAVTKQEVKTMVSKEVKDALIDHCPFKVEIEDLKEGKEKNSTAIINIHTKLQQIDINVQNVCESLKVPYLGRKNGKT